MSSQKEETSKKEYVSPQLIEYGDVMEITLGGTRSNIYDSSDKPYT